MLSVVIFCTKVLHGKRQLSYYILNIITLFCEDLLEATKHEGQSGFAQHSLANISAEPVNPNNYLCGLCTLIACREHLHLILQAGQLEIISA